MSYFGGAGCYTILTFMDGHVLKGLNNFYQINYSHTNGAGCYITGAGCYIFVKVMQIKTTKLPIASIYNTYQT